MKFVPNSVSSKVAMTILKTKKNSPTLLFGAGVAGVIGTVVLSSRATLKVEDILDETNAQLQQVRELKHDQYSDDDRKKDKAIIYAQTSVKLAKLYAPSVALGVISIGCLVGSHRTLTKRNAALTAAYAGLDKAFREYRQRVIDEVGEERESRIWAPVEMVEETDEDGKKVKVERSTGTGGSPYRVVFDETNPNWNPTPEYNQVFIAAQQQYANDLLRARGHVFLNEVHDMLGFPHTKAGQIVGWVYEGDGDGYIDFGVFKNSEFDGMRFVKGEERSIWLDFNVDGNVLDQI